MATYSQRFSRGEMRCIKKIKVASVAWNNRRNSDRVDLRTGYLHDLISASSH